MIGIIILLLLIFFNGLFVMAEIALVSARKTRLEYMAENGDEKAKIALSLTENPELFLSTAQIGITLIAILTGLYTGEKFSPELKPYIEKISLIKPYAGSISTALIVIVVTFLSIVFGELIPKRIGLLRAESIARIVARPMKFLSRIGYPIVSLLNGSSNLFFYLFPILRSKQSNVTEGEIKAIISEGTEQGTIEEAEQEIIERVFHLGDRNITSLMTYRNDIVWFDWNENKETTRQTISSKPHSVYPVCEKNIDNIRGTVSIKDLYGAPDTKPFRELMNSVLYVPENNTAYQVLEKFKESKFHCCFIVDEYGSLAGMITLNDILEAIIGDVPQPHQTDYEILKREDGSFLIDGQIPFYDFLSHFEKVDWMNDGGHEFDTLAGFILQQLERIPRTGESLEWKGFHFEVVDMDGQRIDKVLVTLSDKIKIGLEA
jgi:putative hemolysin